MFTKNFNMKVNKFYNKYFKNKHKKKQKNVSFGIYARDRSELVKTLEITAVKQKKKPSQINFLSKISGLLKTLVVTEFIQATQWELGEKINIRNRNLDVIHFYLIGLRNQHAVYNIHFLVLDLRILLRNLTVRMFYRKKCLINYAQNEQLKKTFLVRPIEEVPQRELMVTWNKWLGGVLTNFKHVAKRILAKLRNRKHSQEKLNYYVTYGKKLPKIPHFVISTGECYWAINESNRIRVKNLQLMNTSHVGPFNEMTLAMSTNYYALRSFTALVQECATSMEHAQKIFHKRKVKRFLTKLFKKYKKKKMPRGFLWRVKKRSVTQK